MRTVINIDKGPDLLMQAMVKASNGDTIVMQHFAIADDFAAMLKDKLRAMALGLGKDVEFETEKMSQ